MFIAKRLSTICINFIQKNTSTSEEDLEKINYGLQVIILNTLHSILLFVIAYLLGIFIYTLIAYLFFAILRTFASGVHANSTLTCCIVSSTFFFGNVYLSLNMPKNIAVISIIFLISLTIICLYAPADTEERPLISKKLRKSLKIKSVLVVVIFYIAALLIKSNVYANLITFSVVEAAFVITPFAYKLFNKKYANYKRFNS